MILITSASTAKDVVFDLLQKMDLKMDVVAHYFALYLSETGSAIDRYVEPEETMSSIVSQWEGESVSKFVFMIRLFMPSIMGLQYPDVVSGRCGTGPDGELALEKYLQEAEVIDRQLLHLQYIQAVYNVITGKYPTSPELALELGAYQFLHKFGDFDECSHRAGFLGDRAIEFIPLALLRDSTSGRTVSQWECALLQWARATHEQSLDVSDRLFKGVPGLDPQKKYLELVMLDLCDHYGCALFPCVQTAFITLPDEVLVSVHKDGLDLVSTEANHELLVHFSLANIEKVGVKAAKKKRGPAVFYFDIKTDSLGSNKKKFRNFTTFDLTSVHSSAICQLIIDYQN
ncbi:frmC, partial [Symbiodinium microadriaticum]